MRTQIPVVVIVINFSAQVKLHLSPFSGILSWLWSFYRTSDPAEVGSLHQNKSFPRHKCHQCHISTNNPHRQHRAPANCGGGGGGELSWILPIIIFRLILLSLYQGWPPIYANDVDVLLASVLLILLVKTSILLSFMLSEFKIWPASSLILTTRNALRCINICQK